MRSKKVWITVLLILTIIMTLSSCRKAEKPAEEKPGVLTYSYEEIVQNGMEGTFVQYSEDAYAPVISDTPGYQGGDIDTEDATRYIWFYDPNNKVVDDIPEVTKNRPLVAIYNTDRNMPNSYSIERYIDKKYTIGTKFYIDESDDIYMSFNEVLSGTSAEAVIGKQDDDMAQVYSISGSENRLPYDNIDISLNMLLGLDLNKKYTIKAYSGTKFKTYQLYSDTRVFQGDEITPITSPYKKTQDGYFIIELPQNMETGYYYLSDIGMFKYTAE